MRLIDADALKEILTKKVFHELSDEFYGTMQALDEAPTIDAEPVVRCKDCEHRVEWCGSYGCDEWFCFGDEFTDGTMFCGKGKRRSDEL